MNALFVANKPKEIGSNKFLSQLKRKYNVKKAGFSGTLDPFASGCLIVAFGDYTKFFRFLNKNKKTYTATMWLGASSLSGDNKNITSVKNLREFHKDALNIIINKLKGEITFIPPKFSAKKINGQRAYDLARAGKEFELKQSKMIVYDCEIISYMHPFLTFKITLSEGGYVRSYALEFAKLLGVDATLSALHRENEGIFKFENEKFLNPIEFLNLRENIFYGKKDDIFNGKKLKKSDFCIQENGEYLVNLGKFYSILEFKDEEINYLLNRISI